MRNSDIIRSYYPEYYIHNEKFPEYPASECVCIGKVRDVWGIFSNFAVAPITINGVTFDCTERLFQMMRLRPDATEAIQDAMAMPRNITLKRRVKSLDKRYPECFHGHWPEMMLDAMKFCLVMKYEQCEAFRAELERSKGKFIVEDETSRSHGRNADIWGTKLSGDKYVGSNILGRLLMELRDNG
ncbi:MAG: NADAR family protein, partial [Bacteroidales bacterium]|nr:NADAR family protein [Bacteroidales bacterium]